jgi:hypothetical protein
MSEEPVYFIVEVPARSQALFQSFGKDGKREFLLALGEAHRRSRQSPGGEVYAFKGSRITPVGEIAGMKFDLGDGRTQAISLPR